MTSVDKTGEEKIIISPKENASRVKKCDLTKDNKFAYIKIPRVHFKRCVNIYIYTTILID